MKTPTPTMRHFVSPDRRVVVRTFSDLPLCYIYRLDDNTIQALPSIPEEPFWEGWGEQCVVPRDETALPFPLGTLLLRR